ncbi:GNAT family N-acetyltransferase [Rossellomorea sp. NPDC077527]|uniref:GNAT family N-acetyltransferase n=1 Tax=Rossellomorea sp. NPDC077527 TaxID=3364510 RepID=UPI0037CC9DAA
MIIREMSTYDVDKVKELATITWKATYSLLIPLEIQRKTLNEAYSKEVMEERFENSVMLIAEINQEIVGYAFFSQRENKSIVHLESLYVHPDVQKRGIGQQLYQTGLDYFPKAKRITLHILKGNKSISFYKKLKFEIESEISNKFNGHPVIFIKMRKGI